MILGSVFINLGTNEQHTGSGELLNTFSTRLLFFISMLQRLSIQSKPGKQTGYMWKVWIHMRLTKRGLQIQAVI